MVTASTLLRSLPADRFQLQGLLAPRCACAPAFGTDSNKELPMKRLFALALAGVGFCAMNLAVAQEQPPPPTPQVPVVEATKHVVVTWTLGSQLWDFHDVESTYEPVKGELDLNTTPPLPGSPPDHGKVVWTLRFARDLLEGEVTMHKDIAGSPFKAVLLDAERVPLEIDLQIVFTRITGKKGDAVKAIFLLPPPDVMKLTRFIRIERRTKVGFETPQEPQP
jgi:hypothetical protein